MRDHAAAPGPEPGMMGITATDPPNADREACHA